MNQSTASIFIADDDEDDRLLISKVFNELPSKNRLTFFDNGGELLNHLNALSDAELPTLLLLDLNMPVVNGYEVLRTMRSSELLRHVPVLILSEAAQETVVRQCYQLGANTYLNKPGTFVQLVKLLSSTHDYWLNTVQIPSRTDFSAV